MGTKCFWLEPTDKRALYLRRYVSSDAGGKCELSGIGCHNASVRIEDSPDEKDEEGYSQIVEVEPYLADPRWPAACACGYVFTDTDQRQLFQDTIYRRTDTGEVFPLRDAPPGAMYDAWWAARFWKGPDGRSLVVKLPNGTDWQVDGAANNCTMPDDHFQQKHHCWTRTGTPPLITVGNSFGPTCNAGAGSIQSGDYHGFLQNGVLT